MKKYLWLFFFLFFISAHFAFTQKNQDNAYSMLKEILSFGPRPSGSKNLVKVQNYIQNKIKKTSFELITHSFIAKTPLGPIPMKNILGYKKGVLSDIIVFAAHYESKLFENQFFLGANDGASGAALLLELMQELDQSNPPYSIFFLFLDGEEALKSWSDNDSLYGSKYQAQKWNQDHTLKKIKAFILLDMIGDKNTYFCKETNSSPQLNVLFWETARNLKLNFFKECQSTISDDHLPFIEKGMSAIDLIPSPFPDYWHSENDTLDKISPGRLEQIKNLLLTVLNHI